MDSRSVEVWKTKDEMHTLLSHTLPSYQKKSNHLLGIGDSLLLKEAFQFGIDTFDSSYPRSGCLPWYFIDFTKGPLNITKSQYANEFFLRSKKIVAVLLVQNSILAYIHHL